VKTTLDIPDDLATEIQRLAERSGLKPHEQFVQLVRVAMLVEDLPPAQLTRVVRLVRKLSRGSDRAAAHCATNQGQQSPVSTDAATGLPVINSPLDAPIHSMSPEQFQALVDDAQLEEDLERLGLAVRH
jgi:hypothetical protein